MGAKALGMLFCQRPLRLSASPRWASLESGTGQRLAGRVCSHIFLRGPVSRGRTLALDSVGSSSCWDSLDSGGTWQSRCWENQQSLKSAPLHIFAVANRDVVQRGVPEILASGYFIEAVDRSIQA